MENDGGRAGAERGRSRQRRNSEPEDGNGRAGENVGQIRERERSNEGRRPGRRAFAQLNQEEADAALARTLQEQILAEHVLFVERQYGHYEPDPYGIGNHLLGALEQEEDEIEEEIEDEDDELVSGGDDDEAEQPGGAQVVGQSDEDFAWLLQQQERQELLREQNLLRQQQEQQGLLREQHPAQGDLGDEDYAMLLARSDEDYARLLQQQENLLFERALRGIVHDERNVHQQPQRNISEEPNVHQLHEERNVQQFQGNIREEQNVHREPGVDGINEGGANFLAAEDGQDYEFLCALGDLVGRQSTGLSNDEIAALPTFIYNPHSQERDEDNQCAVCYQEYEESESIMSLLPCKHSYHPDCIVPWLENNKVCPMCKTEVTGEDED